MDQIKIPLLEIDQNQYDLGIWFNWDEDDVSASPGGLQYVLMWIRGILIRIPGYNLSMTELTNQCKILIQRLFHCFSYKVFQNGLRIFKMVLQENGDRY